MSSSVPPPSNSCPSRGADPERGLCSEGEDLKGRVNRTCREGGAGAFSWHEDQLLGRPSNKTCCHLVCLFVSLVKYARTPSSSVAELRPIGADSCVFSPCLQVDFYHPED